MKWRLNNDIPFDVIEKLSEELDTSELLIKIFLSRFNDIDLAKIIFRDIDKAVIPAELLVNGQEVADRIAYHIDNGSKIFIHADFDSDGINSNHIMYSVIRDLIIKTGSTATVEGYLPDRRHGYGLSMNFANTLVMSKKSLNDLGNNKEFFVVTVDNGVAQVEQINYLIDNGIEVVVTDHHESKDIIPNCLICDPHNKHVEQDDTFKHLCGAGVALKVCELLQKIYGDYDVYKYVANVAIATITDVMPLTAENLSFIKYGLDILNSDDCPMGIYAIKEFLGIEKINPLHIGWDIGPRINACGRLGNTGLAGELLAIEDYDVAVDIVNEIELINETRKELTKNAVAQMEAMNFDNDNVCIVPLENTPPGIVGIVASKAVEKFNKPAIVVIETDGILHGSARSIPGLDLHYLFNIEIKNGNIVNFGGHSEAAGIKFEEYKLEDLKNSLNRSITELAIKSMENLDMGFDDLVETEEELIIDECIEVEHLNEDTFNLIYELPYNNTDFKKPIFALTNCIVEDYIPTVKNPDNLWLTVKQGKSNLKLWCQGMTNVYKELGCPKKINLAGYIEKNFMQGARPYTFKVIDIMNKS